MSNARRPEYNDLGDVEGYVVAGWEHLVDGGDRLATDWDGETHPDLESARDALEQCREAGWGSWQVYALVPVKSTAPGRTL